MSLRLVSIFVALVFSVTVHNANAVSDTLKAKIKEDGMPLMMECAKEMDFDVEKIKDMKENPEHACFAACYFKKAGVIDEEGMFSLETAQKLSKKLGEGENEDDVKEMDQLVLKCVSVNEESVTDGVKGCDRAKLLEKCFLS